MRKPTVAAGLLVAALLILGVAMPALAQTQTNQASFLAPTPAPGATVQGVQQIAVEAHTGTLFRGTVKSITISVRNDNGAVVKQFPAHGFNTDALGGPQSVNASDVWDTNIITPANGVYDVFAFVEGSTQILKHNDVNIDRQNIKVNNGPGLPGGVVAAYQSADEYYQAEDKILVAWNRSADAVDHKRYRVTRSVNGGSYTEVMEANNTSYLDSSFAPGDKIKYQVTALRYSPVNSGNVIASGVVTTSEIQVPQPPPPPPSPGASPNAGPGTDPLRTLTTGSGSAPVAPIEVKQPPEPVGRSGGVGFNKLLPFSQRLPQVLSEQTGESGGGGGALTQVLASPARLIGDQINQNPVRFMAAGVLLLVTSGHLARAARMLLPSAAGSSASATGASSLGPLANLASKSKAGSWSLGGGSPTTHPSKAAGAAVGAAKSGAAKIKGLSRWLTRG